MISLKSLQAPSQGAPLIFTIVGPGGIGKTSLGALFPSPVFIRTEDGTRSLQGRNDIALYPIATCVQDVMDALVSLATEEHKFKTLVLDSATKFDRMVGAEVLASDPKAKGLNQALGGYGVGQDAVAKIHMDLRRACGYLADTKGMHIIFLAHATTETVDPPDGDPYTRYTIPMHWKSLPYYTDESDVVAFIKQPVYTKGSVITNDKTGAIQKTAKSVGASNERIITCYPTPSHVSKNRLGIKTDLTFVEGVNPFAEYL